MSYPSKLHVEKVYVVVVEGVNTNQISGLLFQFRKVPEHIDSSGSGSVPGVALVVSK